MDSGPTVMTMPWVFENLFDSAGLSLRDFVSLKPLSVLGRHHWADRGVLDLYTHPQQSEAAIEAFAGARVAGEFRQFVRTAQSLYHRMEPLYMRGERPSLISMSQGLGPAGLLELGRLGVMPSLWQSLGRQFSDPALRQLFGRYATYTGGSPLQAPATLMLIAYVELCGVWVADGGMQALAAGLLKAARSLGVDARLSTEVSTIETQSGRVSGLRLADGERLEAEAVVFNGDVQALACGLLGEPARAAVAASEVMPRSLSALTWSLLAEVQGPGLHVHNLFFESDYPREFESIFGRQEMPEHPTVYLHAPDRGYGPQETASPHGLERLFLLVNAPARGDAPTPNEQDFDRCERQVFQQLSKAGLSLQISAQQRATPRHFHQRFPASGGALYGRAPHGWMSVFQRASSRSRIPGLYLAGGTVHPGAGVPMAALSGRLAAEALMADRDSASRSRRVVISGGMSTESVTVGSTASPSSSS
ncbi:MAG: phytoene desaturase family protein [Pseudomonadota bacterium]